LSGEWRTYSPAGDVIITPNTLQWGRGIACYSYHAACMQCYRALPDGYRLWGKTEDNGRLHEPQLTSGVCLQSYACFLPRSLHCSTNVPEILLGQFMREISRLAVKIFDCSYTWYNRQGELTRPVKDFHYSEALLPHAVAHFASLSPCVSAC
jgi:hypothetical protein